MKASVSKPQKLIAYLQEVVGASFSGKYLRKVLEANLCRINGRIERFGSAQLKKGDQVELAPTWKTFFAPALSKLEILYEDETLKIVNKPAGWICTDDQLFRSLGPKHHLIHRLDKDTTGLLMIAKNPTSRDQFMELFEKREISKTYLAVVDGVPREESGVRKSNLAKKSSFQGQTIWGSTPKGLEAITHWKRVSIGTGASLLLCEPHTGRTHQIRVHLAEMGHPILIDRQYAKSFGCRLFIQRPLLHAYRLKFFHPILLKTMDLTAKIPEDMCEILDQVGIDRSVWK
ncbi:MAG: RluA family pseudouridine synthase [Chlamydiota bacterium]